MLPTIENQSILSPLPEDQHYQWRFCNHPGCSAVYKAFVSGPQTPYCPAHSKLYHDPHSPPNAPHKSKRHDTYELKIIFSPNEDFKRGGMFPFQEFCYSLEYGVWPTGLQVEYHGETYTVTENANEVRDSIGRRYYGVIGKLKLKRGGG